MPDAEDSQHWLPALVEHLEEASELARAALERLDGGDVRGAVDVVGRMRLPMTQSTNAMIGFLAEMHFQGVDPDPPGT